jgi:hypothetical protein
VPITGARIFKEVFAMSDATVQMRALVRAETMVGGLKPRQVFWCNEAQAQHFIENRIAELIAPLAGPKEMKPAAPAELKAEEPPEVKKSFVEESAGPSTDSAASSDAGKTEPSSASRAARPLTTDKRSPSTLTLPKRR